MRIVFDHGAPKPLRRFLAGQDVKTALEEGWQQLRNGELIHAAISSGFELMITTDQNLRYQQNISGRKEHFMKSRFPIRLEKEDEVQPSRAGAENIPAAAANREVD